VAVLPSKQKSGATTASSTTPSTEIPQGVVYRVTARQIVVAFEEFPDELTDTTKLLSVYM
jgi:hypothetical protein